MRSRAMTLVILLVLGTGVAASTAYADVDPVLAQEDVDEGEGVIDESDETEAENQGGEDPASEVGTEEGQSEPAEEEAGPLWTYQMVWLSFGLVLLLGLGVARWYYMLVGRRQREGV